jgi:hypothetical protein
MLKNYLVNTLSTNSQGSFFTVLSQGFPEPQHSKIFTLNQEALCYLVVPSMSVKCHVFATVLAILEN